MTIKDILNLLYQYNRVDILYRDTDEVVYEGMAHGIPETLYNEDVAQIYSGMDDIESEIDPGYVHKIVLRIYDNRKEIN